MANVAGMPRIAGRGEEPSAGVDADRPGRGEFEAWSRLGVRVGSEMRSLLQSVPGGGSGSARALSARLGIDRNACQKTLAASQLSDHAVLAAMPGPKSLRELIDAAESAGAEASVVGSARAALAEFAAAIERAGGTHRALKAAIADTGAVGARSPKAEGPLGERARRAHYEASAEMLGLSVQTTLAVAVYRQVDVVGGGDGPGLMLVGAQAHIGCRGRDGGVPLTVNVHRLAEGGGTAAASAIQSVVLEEFSTPNLDVIARRGVAGAGRGSGASGAAREQACATTVDVVDVAHARLAGRAVDLAVRTRFPPQVPATPLSDTLLSMFVRVRQPTARLVADMFVERRLAAGRLPTVGGYLWNVQVADETTAGHWFDMLPMPPGALRLEVLGAGLGAVGTDEWVHQRAMYEGVFAESGLSPDRYIGYRLNLAYPVTGAQYRLALQTPVDDN